MLICYQEMRCSGISFNGINKTSADPGPTPAPSFNIGRSKEQLIGKSLHLHYQVSLDGNRTLVHLLFRERGTV